MTKSGLYTTVAMHAKFRHDFSMRLARP